MAPNSKKSQKKKSGEAPKLNKSSKQSFKAKKKEQSDAAKSEALALQMEDDVPDFPRGLGFSEFLFICVWLMRKCEKI